MSRWGCAARGPRNEVELLAPLFIGYLLGAAIMAAGGVIEIVFGVNADGKSLETVTKRLTSVSADDTSTATAPPVAGAPA